MQYHSHATALRVLAGKGIHSMRRSITEIADCALNNTHSYKSEDLLLLPSLYALNHEHGTFVEIGAFDGSTGSNTIMLEMCLGWRGVLIEANPDNYRQASTISGRKSPVVHSAICDQEEGATATISIDGGQTSGMLKRLTAGRQRTRAKATVQVPCRPLKTILAKHGYDGKIDFLSLDVEGAEDIVLRTALPERFRIVLVETTPSQSVVNTRKILNASGLHRASNQLYPISGYAMNDVWLQDSTNEFPISGMVYTKNDLWFADRTAKPHVRRDALLAALHDAKRATNKL